MIYFTSDTHYGHKNICRGTTSWEEREGPQRTRDFETLENMNQAIVKSINKVVRWDDVLYHLGDWSFGGIDNIERFRNQLNCRTIHLILGNHDQHIEPINSPQRNLFASCSYYKEESFNSGNGKVKFIMSHYSFRVWNKSHHGAIHLYGHSHGTLPGFGRSMDVGVDTNNYLPYSLDEIFDKLLPITTEVVDHHNSKTN